MAASLSWQVPVVALPPPVMQRAGARHGGPLVRSQAAPSVLLRQFHFTGRSR